MSTEIHQPTSQENRKDFVNTEGSVVGSKSLKKRGERINVVNKNELFPFGGIKNLQLYNQTNQDSLPYHC